MRSMSRFWVAGKKCRNDYPFGAFVVQDSSRVGT
jgi:hypothetical protein